MKLFFGLELDESAYPDVDNNGIARWTCGQRELLRWLEKHTGNEGVENNHYLRVEQYRQILAAYLKKDEHAFFAASFESDSGATADAVLAMRDELYLSGWDFKYEEGMPKRLATIASLESLVRDESPCALSKGKAERWIAVLQHPILDSLDIEEVVLVESYQQLPPYLQQFFGKLQANGTILSQMPPSGARKETDLGKLQTYLRRTLNGEKIQDVPEPKGDGSVIILEGQRESYLAAYLSKIFQQNEAFRPVCIVPEQNRALDNALIQEGLPSMGILSASLARPTLQILKLISVFLWQPIDPYKILEFVSLPNKPLHHGLAQKIAGVMAKKPGLFSGEFVGVVRGFLDRLDARIEKEKSARTKKQLKKERQEAYDQYRFLFARKRYDIQSAVPKKEVIEIFNYVHEWAWSKLEEHKQRIEKIDNRIERNSHKPKVVEELYQQRDELLNEQQPLIGLYEQSARLIEVLETLPPNEMALSYLRLERLIRNINEPTPVRFRQPELEHLNYVTSPAALLGDVPVVLWWNFIETESSPETAQWYPKEVNYLLTKNVELESPTQVNERRLWQQYQPLFRAEEQLVLVVPKYVDGREVYPHPLLSDISLFFSELLSTIKVKASTAKVADICAQLWTMPKNAQIEPKQAHEITEPFIFLGGSRRETERLDREQESYSSLHSLFYYPHQWVFKYMMDLRKSPILSVINMETLKGNLAHSIFNDLFKVLKEEGKIWEKEAIEAWIDEAVLKLLKAEGAVLLMYGNEPERINFVNRLKHAAWTLLFIIRDNDWMIGNVEEKFEQPFTTNKEDKTIVVEGTVDLWLQRKNGERAVIDLKWSGSGYRRDLLKNQEDLQLVLYSKLVSNVDEWAHTAYFIMDSAKMIARNGAAFRQAETVSPDADFKEIHNTIWEKMQETYKWRIEQLQDGRVEIMQEETRDMLEEYRNEQLEPQQLLSLLEMPRKSARYDIYKVLVSSMG